MTRSNNNENDDCNETRENNNSRNTKIDKK